MSGSERLDSLAQQLEQQQQEIVKLQASTASILKLDGMAQDQVERLKSEQGTALAGQQRVLIETKAFAHELSAQIRKTNERLDALSDTIGVQRKETLDYVDKLRADQEACAQLLIKLQDTAEQSARETEQKFIAMNAALSRQRWLLIVAIIIALLSAAGLGFLIAR